MRTRERACARAPAPLQASRLQASWRGAV